MATATKKDKKAAKKSGGKKKRWSSGSFRSCSECHDPKHNIRTCPKLKKGKKSKKK